MKIIAVVPARNEEKHVGAVVKRTRRFVDEVVVVNDGSSDATAAEAEKNGGTVLTHVVSMGLGFSLATGVEYALKHKADVVVTIDGDGQHEPSQIPLLLKPIRRGAADIVIGARHEKREMPFFKRVGNYSIFLLQAFLFGTRIRDTQSGFRAFRTRVWRKLEWNSSGYAVSSEIVKNIGLHRLRWREVEVKTIYREEFKGTSLSDGLNIAFNMVLWRLRG